MGKILCPIDFSESSKVSAFWAAEIASRKNWELVLFHKFLVSALQEKTLASDKDLMDNAMKAATEQLEELKDDLCKRIAGSRLQCEIEVEYGIDLEEMIIKKAEEEKVNIIVMGTEGAESISDIVFGSKTSNLIKESQTPVLVVPAQAPENFPDTIIYATDLKHESKALIQELFDFSKGLFSKIIFLHGHNDSNVKQTDSLLEKFNSVMPDNPAYRNDFRIEYSQIYCEDIFNGIQEFAAEQKGGIIAMGRHPKSLIDFLSSGSLTRLMALYSFLPTLVLYKKD